MRTEERHPESINLDAMSPLEIVRLMSDENAHAVEAVSRAEKEMVQAIEAIADCYKRGGSIIYVGAGTSGRIGAMDAAEMPPTFGVEAHRFVALVAGRALAQAAEGAEDNIGEARRDIDNALRNLGPGAKPGPRAIVEMEQGRGQPCHVVVGISASGQTPYVIEAITRAKESNAYAIGIANNPGSTLLAVADLPILLDTGPEVLAGSTRLKAGTAQKMALNTISLGAMALAGRVHGNLMTHMQPVSEKLRLRAIRIVMAQCEVDEDEAKRRLEAAGWCIQDVIGAR